MLKDHRYGRECLAGVRANLDAAAGGSMEAKTDIAEHAGNYITMLHQHIQKEDNVLFLIAHHVLTPEQVKALDERFNDPINPKTNDQQWQHYAALADRLHAAACTQAVGTFKAQ